MSSQPSGIDCSIVAGEASGLCEASFENGEDVTLTASLNAGSVFAGWDGGECNIGTCGISLDQNQSVTGMFDLFDTVRWIAYAPTDFNPNLAMFPTEVGIREDLQRLWTVGFDGVITFASDGTLSQVPRIAREVGFKGVVMGLFLFDATQRGVEVPNAVSAAQYVDGYGVGNEGLVGCGGNFYTQDVLLAVMEELRSATGRPVTTAEQIEDYFLPGDCSDFLLASGDWLFPIVHPFNNAIQDPSAGVTFTVNRLQALVDTTGKYVCMKETGWPTDSGPGATEANQELYFEMLKTETACYGYFEYADQAWKAGPAWEQYWGLFTSNGTPKLFISRNSP